MRLKNLSAFTLSEVMIAVVVLGLIAALTIPVTITHFRQESMLSMLKKNYTELQHNLTLLQSERFYKGSLTNSILSLANTNSNTLETSAKKFFEEYYTYSIDCEEGITNCFAAKYSTISGTSADFSCKDGSRKGRSVLLKSGSAMCIIPADMNGTTFVPVTIYIDVNGTKNPNKAGRDLFTFKIYNDFSIDETPLGSNRKADPENRCQTRTSPLANGCFESILLNNWKITY